MDFIKIKVSTQWKTLFRKPKDKAHTACMLSCFSQAILFVTLWTVARQAPLSMAFSRQEYWSGLPHPPPGHPPRPGVKPTTPMSPAFASGFFTTVPFPKRVSEKGSDSNYTKRPF